MTIFRRKANTPVPRARVGRSNFGLPTLPNLNRVAGVLPAKADSIDKWGQAPKKPRRKIHKRTTKKLRLKKSSIYSSTLLAGIDRLELAAHLPPPDPGGSGGGRCIDAGQTHCLQKVIHFAGADPFHIGLLHHGQKGLLSRRAGFQKAGKVAARAQLGCAFPA